MNTARLLALVGLVLLVACVSWIPYVGSGVSALLYAYKTSKVGPWQTFVFNPHLFGIEW